MHELVWTDAQLVDACTSGLQHVGDIMHSHHKHAVLTRGVQALHTDVAAAACAVAPSLQQQFPHGKVLMHVQHRQLDRGKSAALLRI